MLLKSKRLNLKKDFKWVAAGKKTQTSHFRLMYRLGENEEPLVGIALAKQHFRKAHDRNRARRLTSKVVESQYSRLRNRLNLVIMPKVEVLVVPQETLIKELTNVQDLFSTD
jgi:ribonuclease P protein component